MARGLYVVDQLPPIEVASRLAFNTFTTFADVYGLPQKILPKSRMEVGLRLELYAEGEFSVASATSPTFSAGFGFGGGGSSAATTLVVPTVILGQTQLVAVGVASIVSGHWQIYWRGTLRANAGGATGGSWKGRGWGRFANSLTPFNGDVTYPMPTTVALTTITCDVTADRPVMPCWQWGTSSATNLVTCDSFEARCSS